MGCVMCCFKDYDNIEEFNDSFLNSVTVTLHEFFQKYIVVKYNDNFIRKVILHDISVPDYRIFRQFRGHDVSIQIMNRIESHVDIYFCEIKIKLENKIVSISDLYLKESLKNIF